MIEFLAYLAWEIGGNGMFWLLAGFGWLVVLPIGLWIAAARAHERLRRQDREIDDLRKKISFLARRSEPGTGRSPPHPATSPAPAPVPPSGNRSENEQRRGDPQGPEPLLPTQRDRRSSEPSMDNLKSARVEALRQKGYVPLTATGIPSSPAGPPGPPPHSEGERGVPLSAGTDWERLLGERWMAWIGIVVLVLGVAFFLSYALARVGPAGRVAIGIGTGATLLLAGIRMEPRKETRLLGKLAIGGGWALLYFTVYAAHNLEAARVIADPTAGSLLLGGVAAGLIFHSLRYRSQVVTGVAYALGMITVTVAQVDLYTHVASVILAGGLLVLLHRLRWAGLALCGAAATYANLAWWMFLEGAFVELFPVGHFHPVGILLLVYWTTFAAADLLYRPANDDGRRVALASNLLNTIALFVLGTWLYTACGMDLPWEVVMTAAVVCTVKAAWHLWRGRSWLSRADGTAGLLFAAIAFWIRLPGDWLPFGWALLAHLVTLVGLRVRDPYFRGLGALALAGVTVFTWGSEFALHLPSDWKTAGSGPGRLALALLAGLYYVNAALWAHARVRGTLSDAEGKVDGVFATAGSALLGFLVWRHLAPVVVPTVWAAMGLGFVWAAVRGRLPLLGKKGVVFLLSASVHLLWMNVDAAGSWAGVSHRSLAVLPVLGILMVARRMLRGGMKSDEAADPAAPILLSYAFAIVLPFYLFHEAGPIAAAPAWAAAGFALLVLGSFERDVHLRGQALGLGIAAGFRVLVHNGGVDTSWLGMDAATATVAVVAAFLLASQSWTKRALPRFLPDGTGPGGLDRAAREIDGYGTAVVIAGLLAWQVSGRWLTLTWAIEGLLLTAGGLLLRERPTRMAGLLLLLLCVGKLFLFDLTGVETIYRIVSFIGVGCILMGISFFYARYRERWKRYFLS